MSAHFLYARFPTLQHRTALDWMRTASEVLALHAERVHLHTIDAAHAGPVVGWRLMSDNHRELARSCGLYPSERGAHDAAGELLTRAADIIVHSAPEPRVRTTGWFATVDDELVMLHARRYENRSVARNAGQLAARLVSAMAVTAREGATGGDLERSAPEFAL
ncbi:hypothetical protein LQ938_05405 [Microbacterium sp. cx-55]|uniref:hypothetical protein n=1 Tax=Microbacterium sp. cx-55 TaxID=2875948 RepID=UPI001CBE0E67|nr:hypothetical protein [Microbacterium sp. cx-55]MBZ4488650.1 hypothetical protein [Microbacterium sp. cx-55]UGB36226.1 hypothetical protein LQ938_05405 [Microbacterium sp. cx-55]